MEQIIPREVLWVDKNTMEGFLIEPLNQKLYEVYLGMKRKIPSQDFQTLKLFNEVYYQCSKIVVENKTDADLNAIISDVKDNLGWEFSSSLVINMIYAILSLRKGNTVEIDSLVKKIESHYKLGQYKTPFYELAESCKANVDTFEFEPHVSQDMLLSYFKKLKSQTGQDFIQITVNLNNHFNGEIKSVNVNSPGNIVGKEIKM